MSSLHEKVTALERTEILKALRDSNWIMARAARKLGISERMIGYKMRKYGIRKEEVSEVKQGVRVVRYEAQEKKLSERVSG